MSEFKLQESFLEEFKGKQPSWGPLGYITFKRTYARPVPGKDRTEEFWETISRVVEGTYEVQKVYCEGLKLPWNGLKAQYSAQEMFRLMWEMKFLPPGRGLWMMGTDFVKKKGSAALNNCFSGDTKFFGHDALMTLRDAAEAGEIKVRTYDGRLKSATVQSFGKQPTQAIVFKPCGRRSNFNLEYVATPNHNWILSDGSRTTSLQVGDKVTITPYKSKPDPSKDVFYSWSEEYQHGFVHGLIFGDGTRHTYYPDRHFIRLCGEKNKKYTRILERITGYISTTSPPSYNGDQVVTIKSAKNLKRLPEDTDTLEYRQGFLDGWIAADGHTKENGGSVGLDSQNHEAIDWAIERAPLLGYCVTGDYYSPVMETNLGIRSAPIRRLSLSRKAITYIVKEIHELEEKEVFCVTEPDSSSFTLEGGMPTGNCSFVSTKNINIEYSEPFCFLMDMSMLGVGVGSDTKGAGKIKIKEPRYSDCTMVVDDSREGWVELARVYIDAYFGRGSIPKTIDYSGVRPYGASINGFGGTASGPAPLEQLTKDIPDILSPLIDDHISSQAIVDLFNAIGRCVVSGNVRRSAEIMLGDPEDENYLDLKDPEKNQEYIDKWRWTSNNSVYAEVGMEYGGLAKRTAKNGEPGYFWLDTARRYGRLCDPPNKKDRLAEGCNPCSEQTLESYELCCLVETFPARHEDLESYKRTLKFAYLYAKTVTLLPTHNGRTNAVMLRNRRIGTSQSGIAQAITLRGIREHLRWCDEGYHFIKDLDEDYSGWLCVPRSIKVTSVKPSGTVSMLPGATPGIHFPYAEYYWRTIRMDRGSQLVEALQRSGYRIEDSDGEGVNTVIIYFPVKEDNFFKSRADLTIWEQLELVAQMQYYWADNQVSVTVTFKPEEAEQIQRALSLYETRLKAVSFLPLEGHGFKHAPYQPITKEEYERAIKKLKPLKLKKVNETDGFESKYCDSDRCELVPPEGNAKVR